MKYYKTLSVDIPKAVGRVADEMKIARRGPRGLPGIIYRSFKLFQGMPRALAVAQISVFKRMRKLISS